MQTRPFLPFSSINSICVNVSVQHECVVQHQKWYSEYLMFAKCKKNTHKNLIFSFGQINAFERWQRWGRRVRERERKTKVDNAMSIKSALNYSHCVSVWMRVCAHAVCSMQYASPVKWLQQWRCWWQFRCRMIWNELMPCVKLCGVKCIVNRRKSLKSIIEKMTRHESHPFCTPAKWHIHSATQRNQKRVAVVVIVVVGSSTIQPSNHHTSHLVQMKLTPNPKNRNKWKLWNERKKNDDDEKKNEKDYIERIKNTIPMRYHMAPRWLRTEWILPKGKPQHCTVYIHIRFFCSHFQSPVSIHHNHFSLAILSLLLHVSRV